MSTWSNNGGFGASYSTYGPHSNANNYPYGSIIWNTAPNFFESGYFYNTTDFAWSPGENTSPYWRCYYTGGYSPVSAANIPLGSRIENIGTQAYFGSGGWYFKRGIISTETSFQSEWQDPDYDGVKGVVNSYDRDHGSGNHTTSWLFNSVENSWKISQRLAWDFVAGDDFIYDRTYMYIWLQNTGVDGDGDWNFSGDSGHIKGFKNSSVTYTKATAGGGILLGNL